jgi:ArsR family transcriptional regulator, virulence genes transcriptional regulator
MDGGGQAGDDALIQGGPTAAVSSARARPPPIPGMPAEEISMAKLPPDGPATLSPADADEMRTHAIDAAQLLKAMANDRRLMILCMLIGGERTVGELNAGVALSQSALSQHLAVLRQHGLVQHRRVAQTVHYALPPGPVRELIGVLHRTYCSVPG